MLTHNEQEEILDILRENNIQAVIEGKKHCTQLTVYLKYNLDKITDYKGLAQRLININELGNHYLENGLWIEADEEVLNNHLFYDDNVELFQIANQLKQYVEVLASDKMKEQLQHNSYDNKTCFNQQLSMLKSLYDDLNSPI